MNDRRGIKRWLAATLALVAMAAAIVAFGLPWARQSQLDQLAQRSEGTLRLAVSALRGHMRRYEALPPLIADDDDIKELLREPSEARRNEIDRYLKATNAELESSDIYVMLPDGNTIAASNYDGPASFVGENFSYRPYFTEAIEGRTGRFFALGTTSLKRGYYFSAPVRDGGRITGVVVIKVDIEPIEASWAGSDYEFVVTDPEGIIFMTGRDDWLYSSLLPLTDERMARTQSSRRYANAILRELPVVAANAGGRDLLTIREPAGRTEYLALDEPMAEAGWTVRVLADTAPAYAEANSRIVGLLLLLSLAVLAATIVLQRRARLAERIRLQRQAQEELEHRVAERTADLAQVNNQLATEVAERRETEAELRKTQADLVQAGKLAALGQMSAALSHEFNQPLAALRSYAENGGTLIERGRIGDARENFTRISGLVERMSTIARHLRNFARKPNEVLGPVALAEVVDDTLQIIGWRLKAADATLITDLPPLHVRAGAVRLQQVLVNILSNAADAVEGLADRRIELSAAAEDEQVVIRIRDHGPGIAPAVAARIFDPFFSTKGVGKGLGLGLSISYNIVKDFGGTLEAMNHADGGAEFVVTLARAGPALAEAAE